MKEKKDKANLRKILEVSYALCFGGLLLQALGFGIQYRWSTTFGMVLAVLGLVVMLSSLVLAGARLRCPHCDASLLSGGRFLLPAAVSNFCPHCGKPLE